MFYKSGKIVKASKIREFCWGKPVNPEYPAPWKYIQKYNVYLEKTWYFFSKNQHYCDTISKVVDRIENLSHRYLFFVVAKESRALHRWSFIEDHIIFEILFWALGWMLKSTHYDISRLWHCRFHDLTFQDMTFNEKWHVTLETWHTSHEMSCLEMLHGIKCHVWKCHVMEFHFDVLSWNVKCDMNDITTNKLCPLFFTFQMLFSKFV